MFAVYITNILLLYRILRNKDLAIGESASVLSVDEICNTRSQPTVKKKWNKNIKKTWSGLKSNYVFGESEMMKNTRENNVRQERLLAHITLSPIQWRLTSWQKNFICYI